MQIEPCYAHITWLRQMSKAVITPDVNKESETTFDFDTLLGAISVYKDVVDGKFKGNNNDASLKPEWYHAVLKTLPSSPLTPYLYTAAVNNGKTVYEFLQSPKDPMVLDRIHACKYDYYTGDINKIMQVIFDFFERYLSSLPNIQGFLDRLAGIDEKTSREGANTEVNHF